MLRIVVVVLMSVHTISCTTIRCYSGLKYVIGQDIYQDTEDCRPFFGLGEAYCYKFTEESDINEVTKMGCSSVICNAFRNTCVETEMGGMKGQLCCCNERHYCNSAGQDTKKIMIVPFVIPIMIVFIVFFEILASDF